MSTVTVYFVGLCTHLRESSSGSTQHRVVLVNASRDRLVNGRLVPRHTAQVRIGGGEPIPLNGAHLSLNAPSEEVLYTPSFENCIPRLEHFTRRKLPPLSKLMATSLNADLVSAYFDASGKFSAGRNRLGAAIAILEVETHEPPRLTIYAGRPQEYSVPDGGAVFVENIDPSAQVATDHDFLLHFKMLERVPSDAKWPTETPLCPPIEAPLPDDVNTVGPGCSNSTYP